MTRKVGMTGHTPSVAVTNKPPPNKEYKISGVEIAKLIDYKPLTKEAKKYVSAYKDPKGLYRQCSPGESNVHLFMEAANVKPKSTVVDWGAGTGRGGFALYNVEKDGEPLDLDVTLVDFAFNCLDDNVAEEVKDNDRLRFIVHDMNKHIDLPSDFGYCVDVMEHIPEDEVNTVLDTILDNSRNVFFQIATVGDNLGRGGHVHPDGEAEIFHNTVKPYQWWLEKLAYKKVIIHRSKDFGTYVVFYVTGWGNNELKWTGAELNTSDEIIIQNMEANAKLGIQPVIPHEAQMTEIMLLAGGPTLNDFEDEIIQQRKDGMPLVTVNGSYNWAIERDLKPSLQCIIDAREHNKRFTEQGPLTEETKYIIASQCHPDVFKGLPKERTYMWQVSISEDLTEDIKRLYGKMYEDWYPCPGGSTVTLRTLCALRMLGFNKIHVYGFDSCVFPDRHHHAYNQDENKKDSWRTREIVVGGGTRFERVFTCTGWQTYQVREFQLMVSRVLSDCQLDIKGDGMIAYIIKTGAQMKPDDVLDGLLNAAEV